MSEIRFTHIWVENFGWENTIFLPSDFKEVEWFGHNSIDGDVYLATQENDVKRIFKGRN